MLGLVPKTLVSIGHGSLQLRLKDALMSLVANRPYALVIYGSSLVYFVGLK